MRKIKIAFVGVGYMSEQYAKILNNKFKYKNTIVAAINKSNPRVNKFLKNYTVSKKYSSIINMMEDTKPDIVIVCVNELATIKILNTLSKYPCVCLIEKPVGINYDQSKKILSLKKNKLFFPFVALNRRYYSSIINSQKILKKDNSKRIIKIFDQENIIYAKRAGQPKKVYKNWMYANSIHMVDFIYLFGRGKLLKIEEKFRDKILNQGIVSCKLTFSSGDIVYYFSLWNRPAPWSLQISTNKFFIELKPIEEMSYLTNKNRLWNKLPQSIEDKKFKPGLYLQLVEIFKFVFKKKTNLKNLNYSNKLMKLIRKIYFD